MSWSARYCSVRPEIKRLSLKAPRWNKSTDRLGITQANGLLEAGFPYVGILHLIVHDSDPDEKHKPVMAAHQDGAMEIEGSSVTDMTDYISSERQLDRLLAHKPDPVIGLNCVSLCDVEQSTHRGVMVGMPNGQPAKKEPQGQPCVREADIVIHGTPRCGHCLKGRPRISAGLSVSGCPPPKCGRSGRSGRLGTVLFW